MYHTSEGEKRQRRSRMGGSMVVYEYSVHVCASACASLEGGSGRGDGLKIT